MGDTSAPNSIQQKLPDLSISSSTLDQGIIFTMLDASVFTNNDELNVSL